MFVYSYNIRMDWRAINPEASLVSLSEACQVPLSSLDIWLSVNTGSFLSILVTNIHSHTTHYTPEKLWPFIDIYRGPRVIAKGLRRPRRGHQGLLRGRGRRLMGAKISGLLGWGIGNKACWRTADHSDPQGHRLESMLKVKSSYRLWRPQRQRVGQGLDERMFWQTDSNLSSCISGVMESSGSQEFSACMDHLKGHHSVKCLSLYGIQVRMLFPSWYVLFCKF